jgi:hypothetical protein
MKSSLVRNLIDPPGVVPPNTRPIWYRCGHVRHSQGKHLPGRYFPAIDCPSCRKEGTDDGG